MGAAMARHLLSGGFELCLSTRSPEKAQGLLAAGATWAGTPALVAEQSDFVFSMVGFPSDVEEVLLGQNGALHGASRGAVLIDMTTSKPSLAISLAEAAALQGVHVLDAPVSGGDIGARSASLSIMVGGPAEVVAAVAPCFSLMGSTVVRQGDHGAGQHTKMVNQILIASTMVAMSEGLLYAARAGLNLESVLSSVSPGAAGSWAISNLAPRVLADNFQPGFFVDHFVKDLSIALEEAKTMELVLPGLTQAAQLYQALQAQGRGLDGTQALIFALADLSGLSWPPSVA